MEMVNLIASNQTWTNVKKGYRQEKLLNLATSKGLLKILTYLMVDLRWAHTQLFGNHSLLLVAVVHGHLHIMKFLIKKLGNKLDQNKIIMFLHVACLEGHLPIVQFIINEYPINDFTSLLYVDGKSPLHFAAIGGHCSVIKFLVEENKANYLIETYYVKFIPLHYALTHGHLSVVKYFINDLNISPNFTSVEGLTPLHFACQAGRVNIASFLLEHPECDPLLLDQNKESPLERAIKYGHLDIVILMASVEKCNSLFQNEEAYKLFCIAIQFGKLDIVKYFIEHFTINPNLYSKFSVSTHEMYISNGPYRPPENLRSPLEKACVSGHVDVVKFLIFDCHCSSQPDDLGVNLLSVAAANGNVHVMKFFINEMKYLPLCMGTGGSTALHSAIINQHVEAAKYLVLDLKCDPNTPDDRGITPIHKAAGFRKLLIRDGVIDDDIKYFKYFIDNLGCNPTISCKLGRNALHGAAEQNDVEIATLLVSVFKSKYSFNIFTGDIDGETPLHTACDRGHNSVLNFFITQLDAELSAMRDNELRTSLHFAARRGRLETVKYLVIEKFHDPYCRDNKGYIPLHTAADLGHLNVVKWFLSELTLDTNIRTKTLFTPYHIACLKGRVSVVKYLLSLPTCDPMSLDFTKSTGLHLAALNGHANVVKLICDQKFSDIWHQDLSSSTPLHIAVYRNHLNCVEVLISSIEEQGRDHKLLLNQVGLSPFYLACIGSSLPIVKFLAEKQTNIDFPKAVKLAFSNSINVLSYLINHCPQNLKSSFSDKNMYSGNLLHMTAKSGKVDIIDQLITKLSMNPNAQNSCGFSPLHVACFHGCLSVVKYLSPLVFDSHLFDYEKRTPLHIAAMNGHLYIIKYLLTLNKFSCLRFHKDLKGYTPCHSALRQGYIYIVDYFVQELGQDFESVWFYIENNSSPPLFLVPIIRGKVCHKQEALHRAAFNGYDQSVQYLIEFESYDPNFCDSLQRTPLHHAAMSINDSSNTVEVLLHHSSSILAKDVFHNLPLHYAAAVGNISVYAVLLQNGSPNDTKGVFEMTPPEMVCVGGYILSFPKKF